MKLGHTALKLNISSMLDTQLIWTKVLLTYPTFYQLSDVRALSQTVFIYPPETWSQSLDAYYLALNR